MGLAVMLSLRCDDSSNTVFSRVECFAESCGIRELTLGVKGLLDCARWCRTDASCIGVSAGHTTTPGGGWDDDVEGDCYIHRDCNDVSKDCSSFTGVSGLYYNLTGTEPVVATILNKCQNGGTWDETSNQCSCVGSWAGLRCERYLRNCSELIELGFGIGEHLVQIQPEFSDHPARIVCDIQKKSINTYVAKSTGDFEGDKTWEEYENGFFNDINNFWIGLKNLHLLFHTEKNRMVYAANFSTGLLWRSYPEFYVGNSSTNYELTAGRGTFYRKGNATLGEGGRLLDCFTFASGMPFSTHDAEHCNCVPKTCASRAGAGWWFSDCDIRCNPLARKYENRRQSYAEDRIHLDNLNLYDSTYAENFQYVSLSFRKRAD
ncbi:ficolin-1-like [Aplysia californica]|uniref:Ficolin-1-like n=1 Tax=Aplysia californica TaxID=6500 RepID=A0ABM0JR31_APLCA|nr:ficolin-1-like [Aplysia californica]